MRVGQLVVSRMDSVLCGEGERGICYKVCEVGEVTGYSIIFENGKYDWFPPEAVSQFLEVTSMVCGKVVQYQVTTIPQLMQDHKDGVFSHTFGCKKLVREVAA